MTQALVTSAVAQFPEVASSVSCAAASAVAAELLEWARVEAGPGRGRGVEAWPLRIKINK